MEHAVAAKGYLLNLREGGEGDVIDDADCEVVLWLRHSEVVEYADNLGRGGVMTAKTVAAAYDKGTVLYFEEGVFHVEIQRLAVGTRLLCAVEHSDALHALRHSCQ